MKPGDVTVVDHITYSAAISPAQALAYVRRVLPGWRESHVPGAGVDGVAFHPASAGPGYLAIPLSAAARDWSRRMAEVCGELVALGIVAQPSEALRAMAAIHCDGWAEDGDGCFLGPGHEPPCRSHAMILGDP